MFSTIKESKIFKGYYMIDDLESHYNFDKAIPAKFFDNMVFVPFLTFESEWIEDKALMTIQQYNEDLYNIGRTDLIRKMKLQLMFK
jgi:hypothetical protein